MAFSHICYLSKELPSTTVDFEGQGVPEKTVRTDMITSISH